MAEPLPPIVQYKEPADCSECAASCPFKTPGCAYDVVLEAVALANKLDGLGIDFDTSNLEEEVYPKAKACRQAIIGQIREENELAKFVAKAMTKQPVFNRLVEYVHAQAQSPPPVPTPSNPVVHPILTPPAPQAAMRIRAMPEQAVVAPVLHEAQVRPTRGSNDLYVNEGDEALEAQLRADPSVKSVSVNPRCRVADLADYTARMTAHFSQAPFEACLGVVAKYWKKDNTYCQVRVWYKGQLGMKEALATLKAPAEASAPVVEAEALS